MELRYEVLGPVRVLRGDAELDLGPARQRAVLAVLLTAPNEPVPTGRIVDAVWRDEPPANGPNVVQKYVAGLRRVLEPDRAPRAPGQVLDRTDAGYRLRVGPGCLDADRAAALVRAGRAATDPVEAERLLAAALAGWQAPAFAGLDGPVVVAARTRLDEARVAAWEDWAEVALGTGRAVELVPELGRMVAEHPARERLRGLLMLALHRSGRQAEALAAYQDARRHLADEYGVEPGAQLRAVHTTVLTPTPPPPPPTPTTPPPTPAAPIPTSTAPAVRASAPAGPASAPPAPAGVAGARVGGEGRRGVWGPVARAVLAVLACVLTAGVASWAVLALFAATRHSRPLALAAAGYFVLIAFALVAIDPDRMESVRTALGSVAMIAATFGGAAHAAALVLRRPA